MVANGFYVCRAAGGLGNSPLETNKTHVDSQSVVKRIMTRTQIQLPDSLYHWLREIAEQQDWLLSDVMRKAAEHFVIRFPEDQKPKAVWRFPTLDCGGDFLADPASLRPEAHS